MYEDFVVTRPRYHKVSGVKQIVPGTGALPESVPGELRVFLNVMLERLLHNIWAKQRCAELDYNPIIASTVKSKRTGDIFHYVGGETSYADAIDRDLTHLRATWAAFGINSPEDEDLQRMAGLVDMPRQARK